MKKLAIALALSASLLSRLAAEVPSKDPSPPVPNLGPIDPTPLPPPPFDFI